MGVSPSPPAPALEPPARAPSRAEVLALRVLQAGALAAVLLVVPYAPFELDRFSVPKELALHAAAFGAGLLMLGAARRLRPTRVDALLAAFLLASGLSALLAQNGWLAARALAVSASGVAVFWVGRGLGAAGASAGSAGPLAQRLLRTLALTVVVAAVAALAQAYGLRTVLFAEDRAPGGLLGNRNGVGHFAALGFPVVALAALEARRLRGVGLGAAGAGLAVAALVLTRSRAAWLGFAVVAAVLVVGLVVLAFRYRAWRLLGRFALVTLAVAAGVTAALTLPNALRWTSDDPYLDTARNVVNYEEGSGRGRLVQYRTSLGIVWDDPLLGAGPGNWPVAYPGHAAPGDPSMSPHEAGRTTNPWPSSDLVALVTERGLAGALLLALAGAGLAVGTWRGLRAAATPEAALRALTLLALLGAAVVVGAFDAVLLLAWPTLLFWAAAGALWAPETTPALPVAPWVRAAALAVLALAAGVAAVRSTGQVAAMAYYTADGGYAELERAARLDPGNYRLRVRLAQRAGDREARCRHAQAAHALFPHAATAARLARRCE